MDDREKIEAAKEWWSDNCMKPWADWDAMMELGGILKDDPEPEPVLERVRELWSEPVPAPYPHRKKLDPMPYVQFYGTMHEERFSATDPMRVRGMFLPRPGFEQERKRYDESLRFATRRRGV